MNILRVTRACAIDTIVVVRRVVHSDAVDGVVIAGVVSQVIVWCVREIDAVRVIVTDVVREITIVIGVQVDANVVGVVITGVADQVDMG